MAEDAITAGGHHARHLVCTIPGIRREPIAPAA